MRSVSRAAPVVAAACLVLASAAPAMAQSFFETLFGGPKPQPVVRYPQPQPQPPPFPSYGHRTPQFSPFNPYRVPPVRDADDTAPARGGGYRTVCVRMCDGYYWPISASTSRNGFYRDANACRASCGQEARLFYHSARSGDASDMVDLTGRAYVRLPNAFRYRKKLVEGCKCRPEPWAQSEIDRHRAYALNETQAEQERRKRLAAAARPDAPDTPETRGDPAPQPVADPVREPERRFALPDIPDARHGANPDPVIEPRLTDAAPRAEPAPEPVARPQPRPARYQAPPPRRATVPAAGPSGGGFFGGGNKLRWPGD